MAEGIVFRKVRGRIIPMRRASDGVYKMNRNPSGKAVVKAVGAGLVAGAVAGSIPSGKSDKAKSSAFKFGSSALTVAAGVIGGLPIGGVRAMIASQVVSIGLDAAATSLNAISVSHMNGSRKDKLKQFAKQEATNFALGYAAFGATVLSNRGVRARIASSASRFFSKIRR